MRNEPLALVTFVSMLALAATSMSSTALAEGARALDGERKIESATFGADAALPRAVVDVSLARRFATGKEVRAAAAERVSVALPELALDADKRAVVLVAGGRRVVCATLDGDAVKDAGNCRIVATIEPRVIDGGGRSVVREHLVVRVEPR